MTTTNIYHSRLEIKVPKEREKYGIIKEKSIEISLRGPGKMTPKGENELMRKIIEICQNRKRKRRRKKKRAGVAIFDTRQFEMHGRIN